MTEPRLRFRDTLGTWADVFSMLDHQSTVCEEALASTDSEAVRRFVWQELALLDFLLSTALASWR